MDKTIRYDTPDSDGFNALGPTSARPLAGDHTDDDGLLIDETLTPASDGVAFGEADFEPHPAETFEDPISTMTWALDGPRPTTRIITGTIPLIAGVNWATTPATLGSPIQVLPADPSRVSLRFRLSSGSNDVRWSDELSTCYGAGMMSDTDQPVDVDHTGALWILPTVADQSDKYFHFHAVVRNA